MTLLDLIIKVGLKDEASSGIGKVASKVTGTVGKIASTATKAIGVGVAATAAGVAAVTTMSTQAYAAYEQNVGGIQKIFGNMGKSLEDYASMTGQTVDECSDKWQQLEAAQNKALENADNAYKTCGLSANAYMEQVTGFSASLVASLSGDTVKAVDYANTAMVDMSDNANTFGTDMESLTNAYQGFAKQNYTMLDNLKLGYGGTKEEMQRLIKDAHAVNSAVDESSLSFDNIVMAIHTMQEQMHISGLTAEEAAEAVASGAMTQEEAYAAMGTTAREAATTIEGSVNSMKAAWENWVTELGKDDADMAKLTERLVQSVETAASNIVPRVATIVSTALTQLPGLILSVGPVVGQAFLDIFTDGVKQAADSIGGPVGDILNTVTDGVSQIRERFEGLKQIWDVGDNPFESLRLAMAYGIELLRGDLDTAFDGLLDLPLGEMIDGAVEVLTGGFESMASLVPDLASHFADVGAEVVPHLAEGIEQGLSSLSEVAANLMTSLGGYLSENLPTIMEQGLQILTGLSESIAENVGVLAEGAANLIVGLAQGIAESLPTIIEQGPVIVQNLADAINENAPTLISAGLQAILILAQGIVEAIPTLVANIPAIFEAFVSVWSALDWLSLGSKAIEFLGNGITGAITFVTQGATTVLEGIKGVIQKLPQTLSELGKGGIQALGNAITGAVGSVKTAAKSVFDAVVNGIKTLPSKMAEIGGQIVQGIANGISGGIGIVTGAIGNVVSSAIEGAKSLLGIHSPSRVFRKLFSYVPEGAALGIEDKADEPVQAMRSMAKAVERAATVSASVSGGGAYGASAYGAVGAAGGGKVYNVYIDGDALGIDSRMLSCLKDFVSAVEQQVEMGVA